MYNPFTLEKKTLLITGASSGIGRAIAVDCSRSGGKLIITGRNPENLRKTLDLLEGDFHREIVADLQSSEYFEIISENSENLDGIVFCAGITNYLPVKFITPEKLNEIMQTNFFSNVMITRSLIKRKKLNPSASIVFISSISTYYPAVGGAMYAASKGAIRSFAKVLAKELGPQKIRVNTVEPGMIRTDLIAELTQEQIEDDRKKYLLGRHGTPFDITGIVIYLLSDASQWVTGSDFVIDGGASLY